MSSNNNNNNDNTEINYVKSMSQLHTAIINGFNNSLNANLENNKKIFISAYPNIEKSLKVPAIIIELAEIENANDFGDDTTTINAIFEARVVLSPTQNNAHLMLRELVLKVIKTLRFQTWGLVGVDCCQFINATNDVFYPDGSKVELEGYLCWNVRWTQQVKFGEPQQWWEGYYPLDVYLGIDPETGLGNEDKYWKVGETTNDKF